MKVFVLSYIGPKEDRWWGKFIGVYSSQAQALRAIERFQSRPDFRDYPQGFQVDATDLDEDYEQARGFFAPPPTPPPTPNPPES